MFTGCSEKVSKHMYVETLPYVTCSSPKFSLRMLKHTIIHHSDDDQW